MLKMIISKMLILFWIQVNKLIKLSANWVFLKVLLKENYHMYFVSHINSVWLIHLRGFYSVINCVEYNLSFMIQKPPKILPHLRISIIAIVQVEQRNES